MSASANCSTRWSMMRHRRHPALRRKRGRCAPVPFGAARGGANQTRGRSQGRAFARGRARRGDGTGIVPDTVFDAALTRAGTVRVRTYTQLFAAARILAMGKIPAASGSSSYPMAAVPASLPPIALRPRALHSRSWRQPRSRAGRAVATGDRPRESRRRAWRRAAGQARRRRCRTLSDPNADAILVLHVPRPIIGALEAAHAVAAVARGSDKPVLGAWLGAVTGRTCRTLWARAESRTSSRRKTPSMRFRISPPIAATRNGCSRCRRPNRIPSRRISPRPSASASTHWRRDAACWRARMRRNCWPRSAS